MNWWPISLLFSSLNPLSSQSQFQSRLVHALSLSQIEYTNLVYRQFQNEAEFSLIDQQQNISKIIVSTQKNPYWQVASLQRLQKTAKIKNKIITQVDLSLNHPYAIFKNN